LHPNANGEISSFLFFCFISRKWRIIIQVIGLPKKITLAKEFVVFGLDIETTGLNPFRDKIITIQLRIRGQNHIWTEWGEDGEAKVISNFLNFWETIPRSKRIGGATFVGFNVLHFDIPFITERYRILGLPHPELVWKSLVHYPIYVDLYQLLGDNLMGFARWKGLLVGKAEKALKCSGKDIPAFYENGEHGKILEYINDEMESLEKIYYAMKEDPFYKKLLKLRLKADARG
jgi:hypothetical protein